MESDELLDAVTGATLAPRGGVDSAIGHWSHLRGGLHASPQDFYAAVATAIKAAEMLDCRLSRVDWRQGGWPPRWWAILLSGTR